MKMKRVTHSFEQEDSRKYERDDRIKNILSTDRRIRRRVDDSRINPVRIKYHNLDNTFGFIRNDGCERFAIGRHRMQFCKRTSTYCVGSEEGCSDMSISMSCFCVCICVCVCRCIVLVHEQVCTVTCALAFARAHVFLSFMSCMCICELRFIQSHSDANLAQVLTLRSLRVKRFS